MPVPTLCPFADRPAEGFLVKYAALSLTFMLSLLFCVSSQAQDLPVQGYKVVAVYPHDRNAFTQGLFIRDGYFYESTGLKGQSTIRQVAIQTGQVLKSVRLPDTVFGEGIIDWQDRVIGVTWTAGIGVEIGLKDFKMRRTFRYEGQGWGLTKDDSHLILSDGTNILRKFDPETLQEVDALAVTAKGQPVKHLNELEWVDGEIFANVWMTDRIARINPETGAVTGWIDLTGLLNSQGTVRSQVDVLNGIAYDGNRLFVTGKLWPLMFQIELTDADRS